MLHLLAQQAPAFKGPAVQWWALSPLLALLIGGLLLMLVAALVPRGWPRGSFAFVTCTSAGVSFVLSLILWAQVHDRGPKDLVGGAIVLDGFSLFLTIVITLSVALAALLLDDYLRREELDGVEVYALLIMSAIGGIVMAWAGDLVVVFLGLETLSIALYVLAGSHLRRIESQESALKYFVLGGFSSAFFLYGIALVYGATGSTNLAKISGFLQTNVLLEDALLLAGFGLLIVGLGFKVAAAPFHWWTPDVYEGAPTPVTAFMASASKAAAFAALLRIFVVTFEPYRNEWRPLLLVLTVLTLLVGSIFAVIQTNVKRMMAYSSISHAGFILVGVVAASARGISASLFYLLVYALMIVGTFGVITLVGRKGDAAHSLDAYRGLSKRRPGLALAFTVLLLSQAGVPFTSGFAAKLGVIGAAVDQEQYALGVIAMVAAVVAAYVYLRIVVSMYLNEPAEGAGTVRIPLSAGVALTISVAATLIIGIVPGPIIDFARHAIPFVPVR